MIDPTFEPEEQPTRLELFAALGWLLGPIGCLWVGIKLVTTLFPDWHPYLQIATVVIPELAVLYGIGLWRRRKHA